MECFNHIRIEKYQKPIQTSIETIHINHVIKTMIDWHLNAMPFKIKNLEKVTIYIQSAQFNTNYQLAMLTNLLS